MKVFVIGATGDQGLPLVAALLAAGHEVSAGMRDPDSLRGPVPAQARRISSDLADIPGLTQAMRGHDAVALHLPFVHDIERARQLGRAVAQAADEAGIGRIVFNTSCYVADHDLGLPAHDGRRAIEAELGSGRATFTSIRPMVFMDNLIRRWARPAIVEKGIFAYPAGPELRISWVCLADVAAAMVAALERDDTRSAHIALGGPEALVGDEVAERLARSIGRPVCFVPLSPIGFAENMAEMVTGSRVVPEGSVYHGMARFYQWYNSQPTSPLVVYDNPLGIEQTSLENWATRQDWGMA